MKIKWYQQKENMELVEREGVPYLRFPSLENSGLVTHGFSTRLGGVSQGIYASMNLSFTRGDQEEAVRENFRRISGAIGFPMENLVFSDQTHTTHVQVMKAEDKGNGMTRAKAYHDVDGMITNVPGLVLATFYADCVPLYFLDPEHRAIGLSHSGWRGTVGKIGRVTVEAMTREYGTRPEQILAAIGPSICQDCYEVSQDVIEEFRQQFHEKWWPELFYSKGQGKYQLNLWKANEIVLLEAGILPEHLSLSNLCTCCNPEFLFSHRASKGRRGNLGAFLGLKES